MRSNASIVISMESLRVGQQGDVAVHDWDGFVTGGESHVEDAKARGRAMTRDDLACLIYTSGTGGAPRGVMQPPCAIPHKSAGAAEVLVTYFGNGGDRTFPSFLPLHHPHVRSGERSLWKKIWG